MNQLKIATVLSLLLAICPQAFSQQKTCLFGNRRYERQIEENRRRIDEQSARIDRLSERITQLLLERQAPRTPPVELPPKQAQPQSSPEPIIIQILPIDSAPRQQIPVDPQPRQQVPVDPQPRQQVPVDPKPRQPIPIGQKPRQQIPVQPPTTMRPQRMTRNPIIRAYENVPTNFRVYRLKTGQTITIRRR